MKYHPDRHHRRSIRLKGYDYRQAGAYFVTFVTQDRAPLFGEVTEGDMRLNDAGRLVQKVWKEIPSHFPYVELDAFVIMPNHVHGILVIVSATVGATHASPPQMNAEPNDALPPPLHASGPTRQSIGAIVGSFKSAASKGINEWRGTPGASVWLRNYYEHIIRDEESLNRIRGYIDANPAQWADDRENPTTTIRGTGP